MAPKDRQDELLGHAVEYAKRRRWTLSFYNIGRSNLPLYKRHGCEISKCGEEPLVNLRRCEWKGKDYEWIRRQENYCKRQGATVEEVTPDPKDPRYRDEIAPQLQNISDIHLANTLHGRELQFFVGLFDPFDLDQRRLFVCWHEEKVVAFVVCNPCLAGTMWAVEIYRKLPDAPRGVVPFTITQCLRQLKEEGIEYASLSLIPLLRCDPELHKGNGLWYFVCNFWWKRMNWVFDMQGIYHFKSRFRPEYREMFIAVSPKVSVGSVFAMGMTWEIILFNPLRLVSRGWRKWRLGQRKTLAKPAWRPERVVRDVKKGKQKKESGGSSDSGQGGTASADTDRSERVPTK